MTAVIRYFDGLELGLCLRINRYGQTGGVRRFFSTISRMGDGAFWVVTGGACAIPRGFPALPFILETAAASAAGVLIYKAIKNRLSRERPYIASTAILCGTAPLDRYSFPSGHTLHAVSLTILFADFEPLSLVVTVPFAVLVAISRVVLGLHYPSDVLAGAALGAALSLVVLSI